MWFVGYRCWYNDGGVGGLIDINVGIVMGRVCLFLVGGEFDVIIEVLGFFDFVCNILKKSCIINENKVLCYEKN